jgi:hypothetical protein
MDTRLAALLIAATTACAAPSTDIKGDGPPPSATTYATTHSVDHLHADACTLPSADDAGKLRAA